MGSYKYTKYANNIPVIEKYIDGAYEKIINTGIYNASEGRKFNYFVLEPDPINTTRTTSYILRVYTPIQKYQVFACGAGGHGGAIYGAGGNGGNYLYIDNINDANGHIRTGSYLITPGKAIDIFENKLDIEDFNRNLRLNGNFYLIKYPKNNFIEFKTLNTIDNYKKVEWRNNFNVDGTITDITTIRSDAKIDRDKVYEIIFYLKKGTSFKFNDFKDLIYTRVIKISNNDNISTLYTPDRNDNFTYTAGTSYDEIITIIFYQNSNESLNERQLPLWSSIFDISYAKTNFNNFYINDLMGKKNYVNGLSDNINNMARDSAARTLITYNLNPDADYATLVATTANLRSIDSGNHGNICFISTRPDINTKYMLKNFYMPSLFALSINLLGGNAGTTLSQASSPDNIIYEKLGGGGNNKNLRNIPGRNISINRNTIEWISGAKGYFSSYFKLYAYYPHDPNIEMNNTTLANGGYTGYWQFMKDEIDYTYGANGLNNLKSPFYGTYGCGGQGGSVLLNRNSNFTGSKGKDGVFILSFLNSAKATIINDNSIVINKMLQLFGINNDKLKSITSLTSDNTVVNISNNRIKFKEMINNLFIHKGNIHIDAQYITELNTYVPKAYFNSLLAAIFIIYRIYHVVSQNLHLINMNNITQIQINFVTTSEQERIEINGTAQLLIYVCDKIDNKYLQDYFTRGSQSSSTYRSLFSQVIDTITIIKENNNIKANINASPPEIIDNSYIEGSNEDANKYLITISSYIFDIEQKNLKIHINALKTVYHILWLNVIIYVIIYYSSLNSFSNYTETIIDVVYNNLKEYNLDLKKITDKIKEHNNIFEEQNEFKLFFNNSINDYNDYYDENVKFNNLIVSKKAYTNTKRKFRDVVNIFTLIIFIIVIIMIVWLLYVIIFNSNAYDAMPHLLLMALILIIIVIIIHYFNYSYSYKEFFINEEDHQLVIYDINNTYDVDNISYNNENYKITYINSNVDFSLQKNLETSIILINKGTDATTSELPGIGGTINIYDPSFVAANIKENERNTITITPNEIRITDLIKTNNRVQSDNPANIKIFYNNSNNNNSSNFNTLINYFNDEINSNNYNIDNYNTSNYGNTAFSGIITANYSNVDFKNVSSDVINNPKLNEILNIVLNTSNISSSYYGSSGNIDTITTTYYPNAYGLGGSYINNASGNEDNTDSNKIGNSGVCIIINKQIDFTPIHLDVQTLINMFNNNLNKYIYNEFNKIYLIDNNVIYDNALVAFRKRYDEENVKNNKYKKYETKINDYSMNILADVYFRYEITKIFIYIYLALIICVIIYVFNKEHLLLILLTFILIVVVLISYFYFNVNINTRRDYYKYYWSKYNND